MRASTCNASPQVLVEECPKQPEGLVRFRQGDVHVVCVPEPIEQDEARIDAVAPVKMIVPFPRGTITFAASRPARKPESAAISHTFR